MVTNYKGDRRYLATLDLGLWIYDALCLFGNYRNHRTFGAKKTLELEPGLKPDGLQRRHPLLRLPHRRRAADAGERARRAVRWARWC